MEGEVKRKRGTLNQVPTLKLIGQLRMHVTSRLLDEAEIVLVGIGGCVVLKVAEVMELEPVGHAVVVVVFKRIDEPRDEFVATNVLLSRDDDGIEGAPEGIRLALAVQDCFGETQASVITETRGG